MRKLIQIGVYDAYRYEDTLAGLLQGMNAEGAVAIDLETIRAIFQIMLEQEADGENETVIQLDSSELGYSVLGRERRGLVALPPEYYAAEEPRRVWRMIERRIESFPDAERFYVPVDDLEDEAIARFTALYAAVGWDVCVIDDGYLALFTKQA